MFQSDKVQSSEEGKRNLKRAYEEAGLTQESLANRSKSCVDTVKRLLGTKSCPNGVERWAVTNIAQVLGLKPTDIVAPKDWYPQQRLPEEFEALIAEKTRAFCGRKFVFDAFEQFLEKQPKGYFTVVGEAGMGKSALAAKYVCEHHAICYFNVLAERRNRPELFLESIRQQLICRYQLRGAEKANLATLLEKASQQLPSGERLVIVVDALDEVEQEPGENLLHLPMTLPDRVYFLLTRRPYSLQKKRLTVSPGIPVEELDLTAQKYEKPNHADVEAYIHLMLHEDLTAAGRSSQVAPPPGLRSPEEDGRPRAAAPPLQGGVPMTHQAALREWIERRSLREAEFVEQVAAKSENNFLYLCYVLPAIANGDYDDCGRQSLASPGFSSQGTSDLTLKQLPQGLQGYYQATPSNHPTEDVDTLVKTEREQVRGKIQHLCGTMRALDMSQPIDLNRIYTRVNILEKIPSKQFIELSVLLENILSTDFERFNWGNVQQKRVPGLKVVDCYKRLMMWGKPGAGKTTFLKYLAIQSIEEQCIDQSIEERCVEKKQLKQFLPLFITLRDFAESSGQPDLLAFIELQFDINTSSIKSILRAGKALILLDGLDEVGGADKHRVIQQIKNFVNQFVENRFIITCRFAAIECEFETFTEVEIADFGNEQIEDFVTKWFDSQNDPIKALKFNQQLKENGNEPIRELAKNPLLLILLCLVFQDSGKFRANRSQLYRHGLDVLLEKWDAKRNIWREEIYKNLSPEHKQDLLSQIAYPSFNSNKYFFENREVKEKIFAYIQNLPYASTDPCTLARDSEAVLKSIEAQHGLLVKRAQDIYSFSHLTFHEYFTAKYIVDNCNRNSMDDEMLQRLVCHLTNPRWREVFLLVAGMLKSSDCLLQLMKAKIDSLLASNETLQQFLQWVEQKSKSLSALVGDAYNLAAIRACYLDFDIALDRDRLLGCLLDFPFTRAFTCASLLARVNRCKVTDTFKEIPDLRGSPALEPALAITFARQKAISSFLDNVSCESELGQALHKLREELPSALNSSEDNDDKTLSQWWRDRSKDWGDRLRQIVVSYHSLGEDWRYENFRVEQQNLLRQYYSANLLLLACINSAHYITRSVRDRIEGTLVLPASSVTSIR